MKEKILNLFCKFIFLFICTVSLFIYCNAQTVESSEQLVIKSKVLGEDRTIFVHTPPGYKEGKERFPVVYLTDAERQFEHTWSTIEFLSQNGRMPEMIVVGITNTDRTRDLTPTKVNMLLPDGTNRFPTSGGADNFIKFFETDLIPQIDAKYRTQPFRMFAGHSLGGLFAIYVLLTQPQLFNAYLAVSPSLWWDDGLLVKRAQKAFSEKTDWNKSLYFTLGSEKGSMIGPFNNFKQILTEKQPQKLYWGSMQTDDEDHNSVVMLAHYNGFRKIFEDWGQGYKSALTADGNNLEKAKSNFQKISEKFGYTVEVPEQLLYFIGAQYLSTAKTTEALNTYKYYVSRYPSSPFAYGGLADAYEADKQMELAKENYQKAYELSKDERSKKLYQGELDKLSKMIAEKK